MGSSTNTSNPTLPLPFRPVHGPAISRHGPLFTREPFLPDTESRSSLTVPAQTYPGSSGGTTPIPGRRGRRVEGSERANSHRLQDVQPKQDRGKLCSSIICQRPWADVSQCSRTLPCDNCTKKGFPELCEYPIQHTSGLQNKPVRGPKRKRENPRHSEPNISPLRPSSSSFTSSTSSRLDDGEAPTSAGDSSAFQVDITDHAYREFWQQNRQHTTSSHSTGLSQAPTPVLTRPEKLESMFAAKTVTHPPPSSTSFSSGPFARPAESHERTRPTGSRRASAPGTHRERRKSATGLQGSGGASVEEEDALMEDSQPPVLGANRPANGKSTLYFDCPRQISELRVRRMTMIEGFLGSSHFGPESAEKFLSVCTASSTTCQAPPLIPP